MRNFPLLISFKFKSCKYLVSSYLKVDDITLKFSVQNRYKVGCWPKLPILLLRDSHASKRNQTSLEGKDWAKQMPPSTDPVKVSSGKRELSAACREESRAAGCTKSCWRKNSPRKAACVGTTARRASYRLYLRVSCLFWGQKISWLNILIFTNH